MNEYFERNRGLRRELGAADGGNFFQRIFARQHDEIRTEVAGEINPGRTRDRHLGGRVDRKIRRQLANQSTDPDILDDRGIDAGGDDGFEIIGGRGEFIRKN